MTLQSSGQISIDDIVAEFGGSAQHNLSEYYRGALVQDITANAGVPTSGQIGLTDFYGAVSNTVELSGGTIDASGADPSMGPEPQVNIQFHPNGSIIKVGIGASIDSDTTDSTWDSNSGADGDDVFVTATGDTGDLSGTLSTWLALSGNPSWTLQSPDASQTKSVTLTVQIRLGSDVMDSGVYIINVENTG